MRTKLLTKNSKLFTHLFRKPCKKYPSYLINYIPMKTTLRKYSLSLDSLNDHIYQVSIFLYHMKLKAITQ